MVNTSHKLLPPSFYFSQNQKANFEFLLSTLSFKELESSQQQRKSSHSSKRWTESQIRRCYVAVAIRESPRTSGRLLAGPETSVHCSWFSSGGPQDWCRGWSSLWRRGDRSGPCWCSRRWGSCRCSAPSWWRSASPRCSWTASCRVRSGRWSYEVWKENIINKN